MRTTLALLASLTILAGCTFGDTKPFDSLVMVIADDGDRECVRYWPAAAPIAKPDLLGPTVEERVSGIRGVAMVRLDSVSYKLPDPAHNNRVTLGRVILRFTVLERLKGGWYEADFILGYMEVGYDCEYKENDNRDREGLAELSDRVETFLGDRSLIVFLPMDYDFHLRRSVVSFQYPGRWWSLYDNSAWLVQAEGVGNESDPHFYAHWDYGLQEITSLSEIRNKVQAVVTEEEQKGFDCVAATYEHQWYVRSGEENWYRGKLTPDGTPIECLAARN